MSAQRTLYVLRHAKSSWDSAPLADHDRPLAPRGYKDLRVLAEYVAKHQIRPDLILCSTAERTRETLAGIYPQAFWKPWSYEHGSVQFAQGLYAASEDQLIERLHRVNDKTQSVMMIGHNPGLQMLVLELTGSEAKHRSPTAEGLDAICQKLPTSSLVTLTFDCDWSFLGWRSAVLVDYVRPKTLRRGQQ